MNNSVYASTSSQVFRIDFDVPVANPILSQPGLKAISYGRTYGGEGQGGLYLLTPVNEDSDALHYIATAKPG